jgi:serine protease Do
MTRALLVLCFGLVASVSGLLGVLSGGGGAVASPPGRNPASPASATPSFADIVQRANPAVVNVAVVDAAPRREADSPRRGEGSGFIVDPSGLILTNEHLVASSSRIRVRLADKRELGAALVGADPSTDIALLKVEAPGLEAIPLGDSDRLRVGEWVCAIGNPYRFDHSVTVGVVSSKGRKIWDASFDAYIQTDAAINPGNSGGPLLNAAGEAVGINTAVSLQGQGIGFAVPINVARGVLEQLRARGRVSRGYLGVQLHDVDPDLQRLVGLREPRGAVVVDVLKGGAAEAAGLKRYDVITAVSGEAIEDGDQLVRSISRRAPGSSVTLTLSRDGSPLLVEARLAERAGARAARPADEPSRAGAADSEGDALGLVVVELSQRLRQDLRVPAERSGVVVDQVVSPAGDALAHGDVVLEVDRRPTPDVAAYRRALSTLRRGGVAVLLVYRPRPAGLQLVKAEVE